MSSALTLVVLGQAYFLNGVPNALPASAINSNLMQGTNQTLIVGPQTPVPAREARRPDYTYTAGIGAHKVHTKAASWVNAWRLCRDEGAHLAVINSFAESKLMSELVEKAGPREGSNNPDHVHIGFHDLYQINEWVTIQDESLAEAGFSEWQDNEPNGGGSERCGSMYLDGRLNDNDCNTKICGFICEKPYIEP